MDKREVVIVSYGRSPVGRAIKGALADEHPVEYAAEVLKGVLGKVKALDLKEIDDVIVGSAFPEDVQGLNVARVISQRAQIPDSVPAQTVNRFCSSGLQTIATAANAILANQAEVIVAGGVESMSGVPMAFDFSAIDPWVMQHKPGIYEPMGNTAENVAAKYNVTREEMDAFAVDSHNKAHAAQKSGAFQREIIPVTYGDLEGNVKILSEDEGIRSDQTVEELSQLSPAFKEDNGTVTAGNSSPLSDGTAFVVLMSAEKAKALNLTPIAKFISYAVAGLAPEMMGMGPVYAIPKVLKMANLTLEDIDAIELNEAFAAQSIACINELNLNKKIVNPRGGALALGHPLGATGAMLTCRILSYLEDTKGKYGLVSMCIGGGMGAAGIFEKV